VKSEKFVVKLKRHSSSYETDQGEEPQKVLMTGVRTVGLPVHHGRPQKFFQGGGKRQHFAHLFQIADDAMPIDIHKTLFPFSGPQPADIFGVGVK